MVRFDLLFVLGLLTVSGFPDIFFNVLVRLLKRRMDSEFEPHNHKDYARQSCFWVQAFEEQLQEAVTHKIKTRQLFSTELRNLG